MEVLAAVALTVDSGLSILAAVAWTVGTARFGAGWPGSDLWLWSLTLALVILAVVAQNFGS